MERFFTIITVILLSLPSSVFQYFTYPSTFHLDQSPISIIELVPFQHPGHRTLFTMRGTNRFWAALPAVFVLAQPVFAAPSTIVKRLPDIKLPDCKSGFKLDDIQDKGKFWYDTGAEQYADAYIKMQTDHTNWAQNMVRGFL